MNNTDFVVAKIRSYYRSNLIEKSNRVASFKKLDQARKFIYEAGKFDNEELSNYNGEYLKREEPEFKYIIYKFLTLYPIK